MGHQLNLLKSRQGFDSSQLFLLERLGETEEVIRQPVLTRQPLVDDGAVGPIQPTLFAGPKGKISSHLCSSGNRRTPNHVSTKMHVMVAVDMGRLFTIQTLKLGNLGFVGLGNPLS